MHEGNVNDINENKRIIESKYLYIRQNFITKKLEQGIIPIWDVQSYYLKAEPVFKMFSTRELLAIE